MASSCVSGLNLPSGFKFLPTNRELLGYYLLNKVRDKPFKCDSRVMNEFDLYKSEPWDLWTRLGGPKLNQGEDLFIFTELKKVNDSGSNVCRTAGSGTWKGDTSATIVYDSEDKNKKILGSWKRFHYVSNEPNEDGSWIMVEYKLDDSLIPKSCSSDLVLCRIRKDRKRKLIEDQTNDTSRSSRRKVPRVDKHDVMSIPGKHILNDDSILPAFFPQGLATKVEKQHKQPQQEFDSHKSYEEQELQQDLQVLPSSSHFHEQQQQLLGNDLIISSDHNIFERVETSERVDIVLSNPNADITHQPNNLGIHSHFDEVMPQPAGDYLMVSSHHDIFQRVSDHESYVMCNFANDENNLLASSFTHWFYSDEEKQQPQEQQKVEHNNMSEGQQSSVSFESEEQQLQQQDQQLLPVTSHCHEMQQQLPSNDLITVSNYHDMPLELETYGPVNVPPNPNSLISYQPNYLSIPTEKDESQFDDYVIVDELVLGDTNNEPYTAAPDSALGTPQPLQKQDSAANGNKKMIRIDDQSHDQSTQLGFPHDHSNTMKLSDDAAHNNALNFSTLDDDVFKLIDFDNLC